MSMRPLHLLGLLCLISAALASTGCVQELPNDALRVKAYDAYRAGDVELARQRFEDCVAKDATDVKSHYYLGRLALDKLDNASGYARRHLEIANTINNSKTVRRTVAETGSAATAVPYPTTAEIADALAEALYRQNNPPQLFGFLQEQVDTHGTVHDYLRQAHYLRLLGDPDGARTAIIKAIKNREPKDPLPYIELGDLYAEVGNKAEAITAYRKAFYIYPTEPGLGTKLRALGVVPGPTVGLQPEDPETLRP
jgi:tetratricopeptide (TPR) repeat protein